MQLPGFEPGSRTWQARILTKLYYNCSYSYYILYMIFLYICNNMLVLAFNIVRKYISYTPIRA